MIDLINERWTATQYQHNCGLLHLSNGYSWILDLTIAQFGFNESLVPKTQYLTDLEIRDHNLPEKPLDTYAAELENENHKELQKCHLTFKTNIEAGAYTKTSYQITVRARSKDVGRNSKRIGAIRTFLMKQASTLIRSCVSECLQAQGLNIEQYLQHVDDYRYMEVKQQMEINLADVLDHWVFKSQVKFA